MLFKHLFSLMSPAGPRGCLSVLIFHRVLAQPDPLMPDEMDATRFDQVCRWLADWFVVLPLDEATRRLKNGTLPARALAITFDDGYADNHDMALPILQRHGLCATFFIATGFIEGGRMWNDTVIEAVRRSRNATLELAEAQIPDVERLALNTVEERRRAIDTLLPKLKYMPVQQRSRAASCLAQAAGANLPDNLMMNREQIRSLHRAGMQIGAHTVRHPILALLDEASAKEEILASRAALEDLLQDQVTLFAYPNGKPSVDFVHETTDIVRGCGFEAAVTTGWGVSTQATDVFQLPRFTPWDRSRLRFGARLLQNMRHAQTSAAG